MIYLLDVNVLLAMAYTMHVHHTLVLNWFDEQRILHSPSHVTLATCATTELGFIRIASGPARLAASLKQARDDLRLLKLRERMLFIGDRVTGDQLPDWVAKGAQTTDGHLLVLARASGARFATLDQSIPGADLIPNAPGIRGEPLNLAMQCRCST